MVLVLVVVIFGSILILKFELHVGISDTRQREREADGRRGGAKEAGKKRVDCVYL